MQFPPFRVATWSSAHAHQISPLIDARHKEPRATSPGRVVQRRQALHSNDERRLTQAPESTDKTTGAGAALLDAAVDGTEVVKADTIEELAALMGVDADTLVKSVETYNTACATGNDTEFGKDASNLTAIDAAPYYAVRIYVCTGGTIAGVKTNLDFQVLREDGSVINGLYAGGETSNREMYAYAYSSGSGVGYALASGRQIGMNLMK